MKSLIIELKKEKRTGIIPVLLFTGILGAFYAFLNFMVRGDSLLRLPLEPMDILLTQLYGMIMVFNLFGIVVAACMSYHIEFKENGIKKMHLLPINTAGIYFSKFLILAVMLFVAILLQNLALFKIGLTKLPDGSFQICKMISFAGYSYITALPVLSFMLLTASCFETIWVSLGIGVTGFISSMALIGLKSNYLLIHPFVIMLKPAMAMSAKPESMVTIVAFTETLVFLVMGLCMSKHIRYE